MFAAEDETLHRLVAVKVFRLAEASPDSALRIASESRTLAAMRHPGLIAIYDVGTDESPGMGPCGYIVMELVAGPSLSRRLDDGPLSPAQTADVGAQIAAALAHVHAAKVMHRDVKPANVLLGRRTDGAHGYAAKLADFGIARQEDATRLTMDGLAVGTPNYLSPEQLRGHELGRQRTSTP